MDEIYGKQQLLDQLDYALYGHRGHIETEQSGFGNLWKNKEEETL